MRLLPSGALALQIGFVAVDSIFHLTIPLFVIVISVTGLWLSACAGTGSCVVTADAAKTVTATFNQLPGFQLVVTRSGAESSWSSTRSGSRPRSSGRNP